MFLSTAAKYITLSFEITKANILSAMEYRTSFIVQVVGMIVNDVGLILVWVIFFKQFPQVRGWTFKDTTTLFAISTVTFSVFMIFFRGALEVSRSISRGELDYFLSLPKNVLWHVSASKTEISAIGDLIFGLVVFFMTGDVSLTRILLFVFYTVTSATTFLGFIIITQSICFWVGNFEEAAEQMFHSLLGFTLYPQTVFFGALKVLMFTLIPAYFVATLPVELMRDFSLAKSLLLLGYSGLILMVAVFVFYQGIKRYESGNLINLRV